MTIVEMVYNCVFWLNSFPHKDGVHPTISPRAIMTGKKSCTTNTVEWSLEHIYKPTKNTKTPWNQGHQGI
jgi:hypothetical protein